MEAPRKYWWVVLVVVPLVVAAIQFGPKWLRGADRPAPPGVSYVNYGGTQTHVQGDVAFNALTVILDEAREASSGGLPEELERTVRAAMANVEAGDFERAIPLFESAAAEAPLTTLKNNLAAAYLAVGERDRARALLAQTEAAPLPARTAIEYNRRRLQASSESALTPWVPTNISGVVAAVTRCDDGGGMLTVEVTYRNVGESRVHLHVAPGSGYLLDESSGETWTPDVSSSGRNSSLPAGSRFISWTKFALESAPSNTLTVVAHRVQRPLENVACGIGKG